MTPKEEFLQKVRGLVEQFANRTRNLQGGAFPEDVDELVGEIGELIEDAGIQYGIFNLLADGWALDAEDQMQQVADNKRWLFVEPIRSMGSRRAALLIMKQLRMRRAFLLDRERGGTYAGVGDLELRRRVELVGKWEKDDGDDL